MKKKYILVFSLALLILLTFIIVVLNRHPTGDIPPIEILSGTYVNSDGKTLNCEKVAYAFLSGKGVEYEIRYYKEDSSLIGSCSYIQAPGIADTCSGECTTNELYANTSSKGCPNPDFKYNCITSEQASITQ